VPVEEAGVIQHDVRGQRRQIRGHRPHMQVVHIQHVRRAPEVGEQVRQVDPGRCAFQQHMTRRAQQPPRRPQHQRHDDQRRERVRAGEPRRHDDDPGDEGGDKGVGVGEDVLKRALHVQARAVRFRQHPARRQVHHHPQRGDRDHRPAGHRRRVQQPADRLIPHQQRHREQRDTVDRGGEDLRPFEAERPYPARRPAGEAQRPQRPAQRPRVGEHVPRVGEQRQRPGDDRDDHLHDHETDDQPERHRQIAGVRARRHPVPVARMAPGVPGGTPVGTMLRGVVVGSALLAVGMPVLSRRPGALLRVAGHGSSSPRSTCTALVCPPCATAVSTSNRTFASASR